MRYIQIYKTTLIVLAILTVLSVQSRAQELPMYAQYNFNMMTINPAFAGYKSDPVLGLTYRNQWTSMPGAPVTGDLTYDQKIGNTRSSFGSQLYFDKLGIERSIGLKGMYSYRVDFNEVSNLTFGISVGLRNYYHDYSAVNAYDSNDPELQDQVNFILPMASAGLLYTYNRFYIGLSLPQMIRTSIQGGQAKISYASFKENYYYATTGYKFLLPSGNDERTLQPYVLFKYVKGAPLFADYRLDFNNGEKWGIGVGYRNKEAIIAHASIRLGSKIKLAYAYEFPVTQVGYFSSGSSEVMLKFRLNSKTEQTTIEEENLSSL